jgi:glutamate/tyrosine decarboxylase-like PLP-dependent enzyme
MNKSLPKTGYGRQELMQMISEARKHDVDWRGGRLFGIVYFLNEELLRLSSDVYATFLSESPSKPQYWPSFKRFEEEVVSMVLELFHGGPTAAGTMTSGGTESIFLAVKAARDWMRANRPGIRSPEIVLPRSAHPAFDKSADYLGLKIIRVPVGDDCRADVAAMADAITDNTVMIAGSAPGYPHGVIDPIQDLSEIADERDLWLHVDACHGLIAPFVKELGFTIPEFDFVLPHVRTISTDLHKWGHAPKGSSIILYRDIKYQEYQGFDFNNWQAGRYRSQTFAGTRPGGSIAAAWAVMNYLGWSGFRDIAQTVMDVKKVLTQGIKRIDGLQVFGDPELGIITFGSEEIDIFAVADAMNDRKWFIARTAEPPGIHLVVSPTNAKIIKDFLDDLAETVANVRAGKSSRKEGDTIY